MILPAKEDHVESNYKDIALDIKFHFEKLKSLINKGTEAGLYVRLEEDLIEENSLTHMPYYRPPSKYIKLDKVTLNISRTETF